MEKDQQVRIIEALQKYEEVEENRKLELRLIREKRREGGGLSQRQRVIQWGSEHPDVVFPPLIAESGIDANGNVQVGFPNVNYRYFRKSLLPDLVKDGIFSVYVDPVRLVPVKGLYTYNNNYGIGKGDILPPEEWHNLKVEIKEPIKVTRDGKGKKRRRSISPFLVRAILEDNEKFKFREIRNGQDNTWTMKTSWRGRIWTVNIHHGDSHLIKIWLGCSKRPLDPTTELVDWIEDLEEVFSDVLIHSEPVLRIYDVNRDFEGMSIPVQQEIKLEVAKNWFLRVYQKGKKVRSEISGIQPLDLIGLKASIKEGLYTKDKLELMQAFQEMRREHKTNNELISEIKEFLDSVGYKFEAQTLEYSRMNGSLQELVGLFKSLSKKEEDPVSKWFKTASDLVDPPGYG